MGFVGSHTVQALADLGHDCVATSHRTTRALGTGISIEHVNVADHDTMLALGEKYAIDGIIHLADPALAHLGDPNASAATLLADMRTCPCT
jgi:UDP-glucose 4-epimerase